MARGTAAGERVVSQAGTETFRSEYDRIFGDRAPKRGRWVQDPETGELVPAATYVPPSHALDALVLAGRFYESTALPDGTVVQTRAQYREYMRTKGLTNASDFSPGYFDVVKRDRDREETRSLAAAVHEQVQRVADMPQERYNREARERLQRIARGDSE
jgi:hypothetical protein